MCTHDPSVEYTPTSPAKPEERIYASLLAELGISVNPQALRIFIRKEWKLVAKAAHEIHDA